MSFDINKFRIVTPKSARYARQLSRLRDDKKYTESIEKAVEGAVKNIRIQQSRSFVVYGEPQSGKTEMMICLTARLLDEGHKIIIILLNDSVQLLNQNLDRFRRSTIDPAPQNFSEILDPSIAIGDSEWIIFAKKNSRDLEKLINKIGKYNQKVIIDDEADYATPNAKINKGELTEINRKVGILLANNGIYIGVTATPARLDLNNTFENENEKWIDFPTHPEYTGQDDFFPTTLEKLHDIKYGLTLLPDTDDNPRYLKNALFSFFVNVAHLNSKVNSSEKNYCMLVHTSGKKVDHSEDYKQIIKVTNCLKNHSDKNFDRYVKEMWETAQERYSGDEDSIVRYVLDQISRSDVVVLNSDRIIEDTRRATSPSTPFTITIGGNIVSRGVTFENLLSMFFTRDVKHKIQQDTYIQRARMFGSRNSYLSCFELTIPEKLYLDWQKCFIFHRLSLSAIKAGKGSPVWLEDRRVKSVASASIDKTTVDMNSGEMSFEMFNYSSEIDAIIKDEDMLPMQKLKEISEAIGSNSIHPYLVDFIEAFAPNGKDSIAIHSTRSVGLSESDYHDRLERPKGILGGEDVKKFPSAIHHIMIVRNTYNKARVVYKYIGNITMIKKHNRK